MQKLRANPRSIALLLMLFSVVAGRCATFSGNSRLEINDSMGGLSWVPGNDALTLQCWFKISMPTGTNVTENMTLVVNRRSGSENDEYAYLIRFNINTGNIEFLAHGSAGYTNTLIERPYLDRWYHAAVSRQGEVFTGHVDGRQVFSGAGPQTVGNSSSSDGVSIGGWGNSRYFFGEIQELSIYQSFLDRNFINQYMFQDQPTNDPGLNLKAYFKFAASTNFADHFRNFAPAPVPFGTESATSQGAATPQFESVNQAGEQSLFDSRRNGGRDALAALSGAFSWSQTVLSRPTPGIAFDLRIAYSSANVFGGFKLGNADPFAAGPLGRGWRHAFETRVIPSQDFLPSGSIETLGVMNWDGSIETWDANLVEGFPDNTYHTRHKEYRGELSLTNNFCEWRTPNRLVYRYRHPFFGPETLRGLLVEIRDFNGNAVKMLRSSSGVLTQIVDSVNGRYDFKYRGALLTNVVFGAWSVSFEYDSTNRLVSKFITNSSGLYANVNTASTFIYHPTNGLLHRIIDPRSNTTILVEYDQYGRKTNEVDAIGRATKTQYGVPDKRQIRHIDPGNFEWIETYDRKHRLLAQRDPLGNETKYTYDDTGNRTSITEPLGWQTFFGYDSRANVTVRTNALGEITRWTFHPFFNKAVNEIDPTTWTNFYELDSATGNLLRHFDAIGSLIRYFYRSNGLVEMAIDANGNTNRMAYDTNGFLIAKTDAAGFTTRLAYNEVGWKLTETNALGEITTYTLDLNGNPVRIIDPLTRILTKVFDANGNVLEASDAKQQVTRYVYDAANQKISMTDRTGTNVTLFSYTSRGELDRITNGAGILNITTTFGYDAANRQTNVTDALGGTETTIYDANGNKAAMIDKTGQRWSKRYDRLNRLRDEIDPQADTRTTTYDAAGRVREIITPRGFASSHFYDGRGRLTKWIDAEGFEWKYDYDGNANITNITDALAGHYVMEYGPRNERILERNQDSKEWRYAYDRLLRLKTQTDANGTTRTLEYDSGGRMLSVTFNTGRVNALAYDDNNNPEVLSRTGSGPPTISQLEYDPMDRPLDYRDAFGKRIRYAYDALGRIAAVTYPDGKVLRQDFDPLNRLTQQVFNFSPQRQFTNTYAYDSASRLIRRTYPNGILQTNTFDTSGQLTELSYHSSNNPIIQSSNALIALTYAYDRNGNKTASTERGTVDWPMPTPTDESASYTPSGRLIDRHVQNTVSNQPSLINYQYDTSGNMTNASGIGQSHALTYDEDNRVMSVAWDCGITHKFITNRYDAFGRRIARTIDNTETRYVLDLSGTMERILCDASPNGAIQAYYVHGPDLAFKVSAESAPTCYHADAMANIIATTGTNGALTAQYVYTPYGRSLGSSNLDSQISNPYLFVGSQGIMEELPNLYFMRARYYSAQAAVFLSTDPAKKVGPGWKSRFYTYGDENPLTHLDPDGRNPWLAALALGWFNGSIDGIAENAAIQLTIELGVASPRDAKIAEVAFQIASVTHTIRAGGSLIANNAGVSGVGAAYYIGDQLANYTTDPIWEFSGFLTRGVGNVGAAIGDRLNAVIFKGNHRRSSQTTLSSTTAGTTPMAVLTTPSQNASSQNKSLMNRTITAANEIPAASGSSSKPAAPNNGAGSADGGGGSSSMTYVVKAGDTLGNIGYANGTTARSIGEANGIKNLNLIRPGQVLTIPRR